MATINRVYIVLAFIFSGIAVIFNIVSLATEQWIRGEATWVNATTDINYVYYGLFQGNYQRAPFSITYKLTGKESVISGQIAIFEFYSNLQFST